MVDPILNLRNIVLQSKYMLKEIDGVTATLWNISFSFGDPNYFFRIVFFKGSRRIRIRLNHQIVFECDYAQLPENLVKIESILDNILL
jgi:hypothetical protein